MTRPSQAQGLYQPLTVAAAYGVLASLWITLSDRLVGWLFDDPAMLLLASTAKGWLFVAVTTLLVFGLLVRRGPGQAMNQDGAPARARPGWVLGVLIVAVLGVTALAITAVWRSERQQAGEQLLAVSDSKAREITAWHAERLRDASWLQKDKDIESNWLVWQFSHAPGAMDALAKQLTGYLDGTHFQRVALFNGQGRLVWRSAGPDHNHDPELLAGLRQAIAQGGPVRVGPWRDQAGQLRLAFLAPVALDSRQPAVVVLHLDPKPHLHPALANWPLPQRTAEAFLFRRDGNEVRFLSARRHVAPGSANQTAPLSTPLLFTARVLRGEAQANEVLDGVDYRGVEALGVVRPIAGTDWWLLAKQDQVELMGDAVVRSLWLMLVGLLGLVSAAALVYLLTQRGHLQAMSRHMGALQQAQAKLGDSEARYRLLAENGSDVVWLYDLQHQRFVYLSPAVRKLLGYTPDELIGQSFGRLVTPATQADIETRLRERLAAHARGDTSVLTSADEMVQRHRDGHLVTVEMATTLVADARGEVTQVQGVSRDISARKAAEAQIMQLSQATEQSPAGVIITNLKGDIEYVNAAFERNSGYTRAEVIGLNPRLLQSGQTPASTYEGMWKALQAGERWDGEVINRCKDGRLCVQSVTIAPVHDESGRVSRYLSVQLDVTAQREAEETAHRLAWFNPLTGLPNRHRLMEEIADSLGADRRSESHSAFLLINVDRFKTVNEALGHGMGDDLLRQLAQRLGELRHTGDVLAHLSADEFGLLLHAPEPLPAAASATALRVAQALHDALLSPFALGSGEQVNISVSVGVALLPRDDSDTPSDVLRRADTALHRAKAAGGQQAAFFDAAMGQVVSERFAVEQDLRRGLAAGELRLFLQPQVDPQGHMVSAEALVRWEHPDKGLVPPGTFISVAEESDLIAELGDWVLEEVCARLGGLRSKGQQLPMAVNVSPRQFHKAGFVPGVLQALQRHGAHPGDLTLEITEGVVIEQVDAVVRKMCQLTQEGVRFSIDDFGTGYSSLAYLKRLPIHELKIDKSFVQDAPHDPSDGALVEAILAVASHLRLQVVAEGVETREQADFLNRRAAVIHQGYLFGRPEPADTLLARWLSAQG